MPSPSPWRRAGAFVRSVLPAEPAHWLILIGSTLFYVSLNIRWWSGPLPPAAESYAWRVRTEAFTRLFLLAGAAGYYLCFVSRRKRGYFPFFLSLVPAAITLAVMVALAFSWLEGSIWQGSVIGQNIAREFVWTGAVFKAVFADYIAGFWAAALGFVLIVVFLMLYRAGRVTLPIHLRPQPVVPGEGLEAEQRDSMRFAWMMITLLPLVSFVIGIPFVFADPLMGFLSSHSNFMNWTGGALDALAVLVLSIWAMGRNAAFTLRKSFRLPPWIYLGIAVVVPSALAAIWPLCAYAYDRIHWAASAFGLYPPQPVAYFAFPIASWLPLLVPALAEEIAWRGFLQPRFIRRYGMARGIFFVGLVWGAFHFSGDYHANMTAAVVVATLVGRLYMTVALSYVLAWLTIRSRSVLPAALAHGFYNVFLNLPVQTSRWLMPALWAACAWILFRYFPVETAESEATSEPGPTLEPAT
jgi:membrane protease YdiL (CAAX protease family)